MIRGENVRSYDQLLDRICATLQPRDSLEEIWIRDIVDLVWDTFRLRRAKASLVFQPPLTQTNYTDTKINRGISYFYEVTSVDKSGNESKPAKTDWVLAPKTP